MAFGLMCVNLLVELNFDCVALSGTTVGYVRAASGVVLSVTVGA